MPGEKRFGTSLFGFNKTDVNYYIEKTLNEFEEKLKEKDEEISTLKNQYAEVKAKYEELNAKATQIEEDREKISNVLIKAEEQARSIIEKARADAIEEKRSIEDLIEKEKEILVGIKRNIKALKGAIIDTLRKFNAQLDEITNEIPDDTHAGIPDETPDENGDEIPDETSVKIPEEIVEDAESIFSARE